MENRDRQLAGEEPVDTAGMAMCLQLCCFAQNAVALTWVPFWFVGRRSSALQILSLQHYLLVYSVVLAKANLESSGGNLSNKVVSAARRPRRTPSSLVASDFTLPRSRRRASSPGARSELRGRSTRRVRRRLIRSGDRLQPGRLGSGTQRLDTDADSILNALERSITARDHAGLSTTAEHRCANTESITVTTAECIAPNSHFACCALDSCADARALARRWPVSNF